MILFQNHAGLIHQLIFSETAEKDGNRGRGRLKKEIVSKHNPFLSKASLKVNGFRVYTSKSTY